jgi:thioredoxin-related protein
MQKAKLKNYLETTTNCAVIIVAVVVLSLFVRDWFNVRTNPTTEPGIHRGQKLDNPPVTLKSVRTLLIAMATTCHYCSESVGFYNRLAKMNENLKNGSDIVAIFPNSADDVNRYATEHELKVPVVPSVNFAALHLSATPTIILLDNKGGVQDFWIGKLSENTEAEVIKAAGL